MYELKCINCGSKRQFVVEVPKYVCPECMDKERLAIPSYFDETRRG